MSETPLDLTSLQDLTLGPKWGEKKVPRRSSSNKPQGFKKRRKNFSKEKEHVPFSPPFDVLFYPNDKPFSALTRAIRNSCKTYELFAIAQLILEKPERFVVVLKGKRGEEKQFFCSVPDSIPFETEDEAIAHVMASHLERFFEIKEIEVEAPNGNFQLVNKCGITGKLLAPPNYHRYNEILKEHHQIHCSNLPFDVFCSKIESDKSQEVIDAWVEASKKGFEYLERQTEEGKEPLVFKTREEVRRYLLSQYKSKVVRVTDTARIDGAKIEELPKGIIRRSIEFCLEKQKKFPLETANNLRGRLRRLKFNIYKKGNKGVSFVCATKRKFRTKDTVFADSIGKLIEFIDKTPNVFVSDLPKSYLGIEDPESESIPEETAKSLKQLHIDLKWLIHEGFVIEFEDGKLLAPPMLEEKKEMPPEENTSDPEEKNLSEEKIGDATEQEDSSAEQEIIFTPDEEIVEDTIVQPEEGTCVTEKTS